MAGALGLVGTAQGAAAAHVGSEQSLIHAVGGADVGTVVSASSGVLCGPLIGFTYRSSVKCVNGSIRSGNSLDSGNFINRGHPNNSGNLSSINGSPASGNSATGDSVDSGNTLQAVREPGGHRD